MFDTHVHTRFSTDSKMKIEDAIKLAERQGISLIITDHMDLKFPEKGLFCFDVESYLNEYSRYKNQNLLLGIEIGMKDDCIEENMELIKSNNFDYVIGSIHLVENMDLYYEDYYREKNKKQAYEIYLNTMLNCVKKYDFIDSMGHIDYISRYSKYEDKEIYYEEFSEIIDEILKTLIEKDICIELNTRRLDDEKSIKNLITIYRRFKELGGKYITIGSDAHNPLAVGSNFNQARELVEVCDLKTIYFKERKMEYDKI